MLKTLKKNQNKKKSNYNIKKTKASIKNRSLKKILKNKVNTKITTN
jgi:hypothetical protein